MTFFDSAVRACPRNAHLERARWRDGGREEVWGRSVGLYCYWTSCGFVLGLETNMKVKLFGDTCSFRFARANLHLYCSQRLYGCTSLSRAWVAVEGESFERALDTAELKNG